MKFIKILFLVVIISSFNSGCSENYFPMLVEGTAMLPNFKDGDRILARKNAEDIRRGDIIFFQYPKNTAKIFFKRVVGLPNETVSIVEGKIFINGKEIDEPYLDQEYNQSKSTLSPVKIPDQSYFVLGDNRDTSSDSRYWGSVKKELIIGKYCLTYWNTSQK